MSIPKVEVSNSLELRKNVLSLLKKVKKELLIVENSQENGTQF